MTSAENPERLLIALEPEAASIYVRTLRLYQLVPDAQSNRSFTARSSRSSCCFDDDVLGSSKLFDESVKLSMCLKQVVSILGVDESLSASCVTTEATNNTRLIDLSLLRSAGVLMISKLGLRHCILDWNIP